MGQAKQMSKNISTSRSSDENTNQERSINEIEICLLTDRKFIKMSRRSSMTLFLSKNMTLLKGYPAVEQKYWCYINLRQRWGLKENKVCYFIFNKKSWLRWMVETSKGRLTKFNKADLNDNAACCDALEGHNWPSWWCLQKVMWYSRRHVHTRKYERAHNETRL